MRPCTNLKFVPRACAQLENKSKQQVSLAATSLRELIGGFAELLPPMPNAGNTDALIFWVLMAQGALLSHAGIQLTPQSFGAPPGFGPSGIAIGDWRR